MCLNDFLATLPKSNENSWAKCAENWFLCINYESKIESDEIAPRHYNRATLKSSCNSHWQCSDPKQLLNRFKIKMKTEKFTIHFAIFIVNIRINIRHFSYYSILFFFFSWKFATFLYSFINRVDIIAAQTYVGYISNFLIVVFFYDGNIIWGSFFGAVRDEVRGAGITFDESKENTVKCCQHGASESRERGTWKR